MTNAANAASEEEPLSPQDIRSPSASAAEPPIGTSDSIKNVLNDPREARSDRRFLSQQIVDSPLASFTEPAIGTFDLIIEQRDYGMDDLSIPLLVYQCTKAIDLHGLQIYGIYQMENVLAKQALRAAFNNGKP